MLGTLPIVTECWSPKQIEGDDAGVDQALEEEVGVISRGVHELQLQGV